MAEGFDFNALDRIVKETTQTIEASKKSLFEISETAKSVHRSIENDFNQINFQVQEIIKRVDQLESRYKKARIYLMKVNRDFKKYSEEEIKIAYLDAQQLQIQLAIERERENGLRQRRDEMTRSMARIRDISVKADEFVYKVDIALTFLSGNLNGFNQQIGGVQQKQFLGGRIIIAQEEERKRVAREIHDGPAQTMANVVLRAEYCCKLNEINPAEVGAELTNLKQVVRDSLQEIRRIIFNLRPMTLDDLGLIPTVKRYLSELENSSQIRLEVNCVEFRMPNAYEVAFFRLIQESITNARKHAEASLIKVVIDVVDQEFKVEVCDNGKGFNLEQVLTETAGKESFGILSMKERFELLAGKLEINSSLGIGTQIKASIPLKEALQN